MILELWDLFSGYGYLGKNSRLRSDGLEGALGLGVPFMIPLFGKGFGVD
jgi:hypothetical protein